MEGIVKEVGYYKEYNLLKHQYELYTIKEITNRSSIDIDNQKFTSSYFYVHFVYFVDICRNMYDIIFIRIDMLTGGKYDKK